MLIENGGGGRQKTSEMYARFQQNFLSILGPGHGRRQMTCGVARAVTKGIETRLWSGDGQFAVARVSLRADLTDFSNTKVHGCRTWVIFRDNTRFFPVILRVSIGHPRRTSRNTMRVTRTEMSFQLAHVYTFTLVTRAKKSEESSGESFRAKI